nr:MAG TPA: helix-turn-helix domain protein [Caudoviricetes sp.]
MVSQKDMVLDYIREFGSITPIDAFRDLGVTRLAAKIFELKKDGHDIEKVIETSKNRFGNRTRYARYSFGKGEDNGSTGK